MFLRRFISGPVNTKAFSFENAILVGAFFRPSYYTYTLRVFIENVSRALKTLLKVDQNENASIRLGLPSTVIR